MYKTLFFWVILPALLPAQSPWVRNKAGFFLEAKYRAVPAYNSLSVKNGEYIILSRNVSEQQLRLYGEYGLSAKNTLVLSLPLVFNKRGGINPASPHQFAAGDSGKVFGLGNIELALRHQFLFGKLALSATLRAAIPAQRNRSIPDLRTGYDAFTLQPVISTGVKFRRTYAFVYGGYGYRSHAYSHFISAGAEAGINIKTFWLIGFSGANWSLKNGSRTLPAPELLTGLYVNDQEWIVAGLKIRWELNRFWGVEFSGSGYVYVNYLPKRPVLSVAAYFRWD